MFNKIILVVVIIVLFFGLLFIVMVVDNQGLGKIMFIGEVISVFCFIILGDENQMIELGEVVDSVLNSGKNLLLVDVNIYLQDCIFFFIIG